MENDKLLMNSYKLICYMATSACNLIGEPPLYGPFRLVDASSRLIDILEEAGSVNKDLVEARKLIEDKKYLVMNDEEAFSAFLNELVLKLAEGYREKI
ncbi:MAG: DUF6092 family protein [Bacillota bacterium]|nr:DUF6092 family protein [Bacillota bacterium]